MAEEDLYSYEDDGGANKSSRRLHIRKFRRIRRVVLISGSLGIILIYIICAQRDHTRALELNHKTLLLRRRESLDRILSNVNVRGDNIGPRNVSSENIVSRRRSGSDVVLDRDQYYHWANPSMLPPVPGHEGGRSIMKETLDRAMKALENDDNETENRKRRRAEHRLKFQIKYGKNHIMDWELEADDRTTRKHVGPAVDYTKLQYHYPKRLTEIPTMGEYPPLEPLGEIMERWPQDDIDHPPQPFVENLLHFDYMDLEQRALAEKIRDLELPFKMVNVPELDLVTHKWTDEYLIKQFDSQRKSGVQTKGIAQESEDSFFAFYIPGAWVIEVFGSPPSKDTDLPFAKWAKHARYADAVGLAPSKKHFYWQSGTTKNERFIDDSKKSFFSRDLTFFSSKQANFFSFNPGENKGIQCRFGERGVTAATHYDAGRNMVAMITGAKRYILAPPKECPKLGLITDASHPAFRHSLINFGHINALKDDTGAAQGMSVEEREWLETACDSVAVETVLKAGEVLYIPSHWFHYITSLQKSAQCNTRSGRNYVGSKQFGGFDEVDSCGSKDVPKL